MKKTLKKKLLIFSVILIIIGVIIYFTFYKSKENFETDLKSEFEELDEMIDINEITEVMDFVKNNLLGFLKEKVDEGEGDEWYREALSEMDQKYKHEGKKMIEKISIKLRKMSDLTRDMINKSFNKDTTTEELLHYSNDVYELFYKNMKKIQSINMNDYKPLHLKKNKSKKKKKKKKKSRKKNE